MEITTMFAMAVLAAVPAQARETEQPLETSVTACMDMGPQVILGNQAETIAGRMFAQAGVELKWRPSWSSCPADAIRIAFTINTPVNYFPEALAFSQPYEGVHIRIFLDRVQQTIERGKVPCLLAHVMAHEIAHMLQGVSRHSLTGVMKARWDQDDYSQMAWRPLEFTNGDILLMQLGMQARASRRYLAHYP
jgi:hypothetical protein